MEQQQQQQKKKMPSPSKQDATAIAAEEEEEVCKMMEGLPLSSAEAEALDDDLCISGDKPFFDIILSKSHVTPPYSMNAPAQAIRSLPRADVVVVLMHGGREWKLKYSGKRKRPTFLSSDWKAFVVDNNLKCEDACVFEVVESTPTMSKLRVLILRGTNWLPPELEAKVHAVDSLGMTPETAIEID